MTLQQNSDRATLHCAVCPTILNREKQLAVAIDALRAADTTETRQALRSIAVLAGLDEPALCETKEEN